MYPFDLKNAGATRAEMLAFKNNDAGECVCACFNVMISHGWPANLPRRCSFFLSVSLLFSYSFFFFTMLLALSVFLLTRTKVELKSYNLNRFAKPTRCHPFNSFLQQPGIITCMVVILFATRGSTPLKKWSLRQDPPPLIWVFGHFWLFCTMV